MRKLLTLLMCFALVGLYSCSKDDDNDNDGGGKTININVNVKYHSGNETLPDGGATIYIFQNFDRFIPGKWEYIGNGKYQLNGKEQLFYIKQTANSNGDATIKVPANEYCTIVIEPKNGSGVKEDFLDIENKDYSYTYTASPK